MTDNDRRTTPQVTCADDAVLGEQQHGERAFDLLLRIADSFGQRTLLDNHQSDQLGRIDLAGGELRQVHVVLERFVGQRLQVGYLAHRSKRETTQMGIEQQRLGVRIGDDSDTGIAKEFR